MSCSLATAIARYNGSSCLEKDDDYLKNLSASLICVQPKLCSGNVHTRVQNQPASS